MFWLRYILVCRCYLARTQYIILSFLFYDEKSFLRESMYVYIYKLESGPCAIVQSLFICPRMLIYGHCCRTLGNWALCTVIVDGVIVRTKWLTMSASVAHVLISKQSRYTGDITKLRLNCFLIIFLHNAVLSEILNNFSSKVL